MPLCYSVFACRSNNTKRKDTGLNETYFNQDNNEQSQNECNEFDSSNQPKIFPITFLHAFHLSHGPQYVGQFKEHGRMYGQQRGRKFHAPGKQVFFLQFY